MDILIKPKEAVELPSDQIARLMVEMKWKVCFFAYHWWYRNQSHLFGEMENVECL